MNKTELVEVISQKTRLTKPDVQDVLNEFISTIKLEVQKGNSITLAGFGTFLQNERKARRGRNPQTGMEVHIPASSVPKFRASTDFKTALNKK